MDSDYGSPVLQENEIQAEMRKNMCNIRKVFRVFMAQFGQEIFSSRTIAVFVVMGVYLYSILDPVGKMVVETGIHATPTAFVHIMNDYVCQTILTIGIVFLYSTAPFRRDSFPYIVYRSGQRNWECGNVLYIFCSSLIYTLFILFVSVLALWDKLDFDTVGWGKIWGTLARTNASYQFGVKLSVSDYLLGKYEPEFAVPFTFFVVWACYFFIGLVMYFCNLHIKRGSGIIFAGICVFFDTMVYNSWTPWAYLFSPLSLAKLTTFTNYHKHFGLTISYAGIFMAAGILIMCSGIFVLAGKKERDHE